MTRTEPEWDEDTRTQALALEKYRDGLCSRCGQPTAVCQAAENEFGFDVDGPVRCHAFTAIANARAQMGEDVPTPEALMFAARLKVEGVS